MEWTGGQIWESIPDWMKSSCRTKGGGWSSIFYSSPHHMLDITECFSWNQPCTSFCSHLQIPSSSWLISFLFLFPIQKTPMVSPSSIPLTNFTPQNRTTDSVSFCQKNFILLKIHKWVQQFSTKFLTSTSVVLIVDSMCFCVYLVNIKFVFKERIKLKVDGSGFVYKAFPENLRISFWRDIAKTYRIVFFLGT